MDIYNQVFKKTWDNHYVHASWIQKHMPEDYITDTNICTNNLVKLEASKTEFWLEKGSKD